MKFSLNFVKEFLPVSESAQKIADSLTMAGMEVESLEKVSGDWVFDVEVTSNRHDWLSILGIAYEVAAVLGKKPHIKYPKLKKCSAIRDKDIIIKDFSDCPYYLGRNIDNVKLGASRGKIAQLISNCGIKPVNNIVDITNYCMLKWGNPLHAFDRDKIEGNIYIRRAKKDEKFIGIDEKERVLSKENLVIADDKKVIALAGVMGAKNTEVDENTKNLFLEAAIFSPLTVRLSRRAAGLDTESSYRFERTVSAESLDYASVEAAALIAEVGKGEAKGIKKCGNKPKLARKKIKINLDGLSQYLGESFTKAPVTKVLKSLNFQVNSLSGKNLEVITPVSRFDIEREVDVYEEFSRVYGYDKIGPQIPFLTGYPKENIKSINKLSYQDKNRIANFLAIIGFKEIITFSLENDQELKNLEQQEPIMIVNPLRKQENAMRSSLLPGALRAIRHNLNYSQREVSFFEIADIYYKEGKSFKEKPVLGLAISGSLERFSYLKEALEKIASFLNVGKFQLQETTLKNFTNALEVIISNQVVGFSGKLDEGLKEELSLKEDIFFAQLDLRALAEKSKEKKYKPFSLYPISYRDISISLRKDIKFKKVERIIKEKNKYLADLEIVDTYKGKDVPKDYSNFTLRIFYQSKNKTLTSAEVDSSHNSIRDSLIDVEGVRLR